MSSENTDDIKRLFEVWDAAIRSYHEHPFPSIWPYRIALDTATFGEAPYGDIIVSDSTFIEIHHRFMELEEPTGFRNEEKKMWAELEKMIALAKKKYNLE